MKRDLIIYLCMTVLGCIVLAGTVSNLYGKLLAARQNAADSESSVEMCEENLEKWGTQASRCAVQLNQCQKECK